MAALATMLRRALPLGSQRILQIAAISTQQKLTPDFSRFSQIRQLSTADENLIRAVQDGIDEAPKAIGIQIPDWFPFEIEEDPERSMTVLRRTIGDETDITIRVDSEYFAYDMDKKNAAVLYAFYLDVSISKFNVQSLLFYVDAFDNGDFEIRWVMHLNYKNRPLECEERPPVYVSYLRNKVTKTFSKYLEDMEICDKRTLEFLYEYLADKTKKEDLLWLNKLKNFVQKN